MPDHPSWPAELVEKAARELWDHDEQAAANSLVRDRPYTVLSWEDADEVSREDYREQAGAVLSALSGDLVPREEHEARERMWLQDASEHRKAMDAANTANTARSQADALAEALERVIADHEVSHDPYWEQFRSALASYRSSSSTETEG